MVLSQTIKENFLVLEGLQDEKECTKNLENHSTMHLLGGMRGRKQCHHASVEKLHLFAL